MIVSKAVVLLILTSLTACAFSLLSFPAHHSVGDESTAHSLLWHHLQSLSTTPQNCFNDTLLSTVESRFSADLSHNLESYAASHMSYIERLPRIQYYFEEFKRWLGYEINLPDYVQDETRQGFLSELDWYKTYNGDVLASVGPSSSFAFFPVNLSTIRFQNVVKPLPVGLPVPFSIFAF